MSNFVPFNQPHISGSELEYIAEAIKKNHHLSGNGPFTKHCEEWLQKYLGCNRVLITHSCTAALEMSALLLDIKPGDEVIMPSFTFVSTANAFVLRGAKPVFVDVREDTLNLDETLLSAAITKQTRAIVPVHYGGIACAMDEITDIAYNNNLHIVEDAAQGLAASYQHKPLGTMGCLGTLSFHETKNIISGEGGALIINDSTLVQRAEIILEKGTNRSQFFRGEIDKYTWVDIGSSYLPSELITAYLFAQLENIEPITARRRAIWSLYYQAFADMQNKGLLRLPIVPEQCSHNGHLFYLILRDQEQRDLILRKLKQLGVNAIFHYVPLHSSPAGTRYGRSVGSLERTTDLASRLVRLPLHYDLDSAKVEYVVEAVKSVLITC